MTFSEALDVLIHGGRVSREAWHGARMLYLEPTRIFEPAEGHPLYEIGSRLTSFPYEIGSRMTCHSFPMICDVMVQACAPWSPQPEDYADDWCEVRN
jgi:hypothetical protein